MSENYHLEEDGDVYEKENLHNPFDNLSKNQKIALSVLGVFAFFVLIYGVAQFKTSVSSSLALPEEEEGQCLNGLCNSSNNSETSLSTKDTDKDGLTDWDELNVYLTSPYLSDSDSDGISDKDEIVNNNDPNCPVGRNCGKVDEAQNYEGEVTNSLEGTSNLDDTESEIDANSLTEEEKLLLDVTSGNSSPENIRKLLIDGGMTKEQVDSLSDDQIMQIYQQALQGSSSE